MNNKPRISWIIRLKVLLFFAVIVAVGIQFYKYIYKHEQAEVITIAVMQDDNVQNFNTNYYKEWLEEKSGYRLQFVTMPMGYEKEYMNAMLTSDYSNIDAVFLKKDNEIITEEEFQNYVQSGLIMELSPYMRESDSLNNVLVDYSIREEMEWKYGGIYYVPNVDTSRKRQNFQVLWINRGWLKKLGMQVPHTSDELYKVLRAFRDKDPNGNGIKDELPLVSCEDDYRMQSYQYLLNAFIYNDPLHMRFYRDSTGLIQFAPKEEAFRKGLQYCRKLYQKKLLDKVSFSYNKKQLIELINDPIDMVGAFTCQSMENLVYANCDEVIARYIYVPPIEGTEGIRNAVRMSYEPKIGGFIPRNSRQPERAYEIMELMLSEEASLISEYGEENEDWKTSDIGDLSAYGNKAKITTLNYLKNKMQNKNFAGAGPQVVKQEDIDEITWDGAHSFIEYLDARAVRAYEHFYSSNKSVGNEILTKVKDGMWSRLSAYTDRMIYQFIIGELDINSDKEWDRYLHGYDDIIGE